jgi:hypothetical protein
LILDRITARGRSTNDASWFTFSENAPGGEPLRKSPKDTRTAPDGNCAKAALSDSEKDAPLCATTSGARLAGRFATIGLNGTLMSSSGASMGGGAAVTLGLATAGAPYCGTAGSLGGGAVGCSAGACGSGRLDFLEKIRFSAPNMRYSLRASCQKSGVSSITICRQSI